MNSYIYQVGRDPAVARFADARFVLLPESERKDWGDYAAIRTYFMNEAVDDNALYGFFSADFVEHTGLGSAAIDQFVANNSDCDVYTFFPFVKDAATFLNVFEEGEFHYPGLQAIAQTYLETIGLSLNLTEFITDFRTTSHTGYVLARPVFWKTWFDLTEKVYELAESTDGELANQLNTVVAGGSAMKSLLVERIASLVLALDQELRIAVFDHSRLPMAGINKSADQDRLQQLDMLKQSYMATREIEHIDKFFSLRNSILQHTEPQRNAQFISASASASARVTQRKNDDLIYGCITHVELPIRFPDFVLPIYLGESQAAGRMNLRELAPKWIPYHPIVGGMVGNFALRNYILQQHPGVKRIGVCMYRKFVSRERISGVPAEDNWMMDVISDRELERQSFDSMLNPGSTKLLLGKTCGFVADGESAGYLKHYSRAHHIEDMLRFTSEAVELGVLDKAEVEPFFDERVFFMGGVELGVFPADFWIKSIGDIEAVAWACVQRYQMKREGYQSRAWAFCAERLGSYLLLRYLRANYPNYEQYMGQLNLITQGDQKLYIPSH